MQTVATGRIGGPGVRVKKEIPIDTADLKDAKALLDELGTEGFDTADLKDAKALLDDLHE